jgi:hypothetical protein
LPNESLSINIDGPDKLNPDARMSRWNHTKPIATVGQEQSTQTPDEWMEYVVVCFQPWQRISSHACLYSIIIV